MQYTTSNQKIDGKATTFFVSILTTLMLLFVSANAANEWPVLSGQRTTNPMQQSYEQIAKEYHLDLSFTNPLWVLQGKLPQVRGPNSYKINSIFTRKPKSLDVLFFGDCTISWGMIPRVVEQMTGKQVAMYGYASNVLTVKTVELFKRIADYYLKEDGIVIFSFSNWALQKDSQVVATSLEEYKEMTAWSDKEFEAFAKSKEGTTIRTDNSPLVTDPAKLNRPGGIMYLRWDFDTLTEYNPDFRLKSRHSFIMPRALTRHGALMNNAEAATKIRARERIFMVPLYSADQHYLTSRTIYYSYYHKRGFKIADLGMFLPANESYTMENHRHMGNDGGLRQSILIAKWLNDYYKNPAIAQAKEIDFNLLKAYKDRIDLLLAKSPKGSTVYLPPTWVDKSVKAYVEKQGRKLITQIPNGKGDFYYLNGTVNEGALKGYNFNNVYTDTLGSMLARYPDALIVLAIMDDGSYSLSDETKAYLRQRGVGIDKLKFAGSLAVLIDHDKAVTWALQNKAPVSLDPKILAKYGIQKVMSAGSHWGNNVEIILNGEDYAQHRRGFNYVIKKKNGDILNGFVDTYENDQTGEGVKRAIPAAPGKS
jgi:hypothetical protein